MGDPTGRDASTTVRPPPSTVRPIARIEPVSRCFHHEHARCGAAETAMDWTPWKRHFERNAVRTFPSGELGGLPLDPDQRVTLARSLARFHAGESGEGRVAREIDRFHATGIDDDYRKALKLFVAEEGRHARLLAKCVHALDGELLKTTWTERLFVRGRRLAGIEFKLLVLLVAEVLGIGFYALLSSRLPAGGLRALLEEVCADEEAHLVFHAAFFEVLCRSWWRRAAFRAAWWAVGGTACAVVLLDHAPALRAFKVTRSESVRSFVGLLSDVERRVLSASPRGSAPVVVGAAPQAQ